VLVQFYHLQSIKKSFLLVLGFCSFFVWFWVLGRLCSCRPLGRAGGVGGALLGGGELAAVSAASGSSPLHLCEVLLRTDGEGEVAVALLAVDESRLRSTVLLLLAAVIAADGSREVHLGEPLLHRHGELEASVAVLAADGDGREPRRTVLRATALLALLLPRLAALCTADGGIPSVLGKAVLVVAREEEFLFAVAAGEEGVRGKTSTTLRLRLRLLARKLLRCGALCLCLRSSCRRLGVKDGVQLRQTLGDLAQPAPNLVRRGASRLGRVCREIGLNLIEGLREGVALKSEHGEFLLHDERRHVDCSVVERCDCWGR
jgi:hypothetical protein